MSLHPIWLHYQRIYGTRIERKADAVEAQVVATALDAMGIVDKEAFLTRFATTDTMRKVIYLPWAVGEEPDDRTQIIVCAHEHQHVAQHNSDGIVFDVDYVLRQSSRALYEAEAYSTQLDVEGSLDLEAVMQSLESYALGDELPTARAALVAAIRSSRNGAILTESGRIARNFMGQV